MATVIKESHEVLHQHPDGLLKKGAHYHLQFLDTTTLSLQKRLGPQRQFFSNFPENTAFFEKTVK